MMLDRPGEGLRVQGEPLEIEEDCLHVLDTSVRRIAFVRLLKSSPSAAGWLRRHWLMKTEKWLEPLHAGPLDDYQDRRFVPPWDAKSPTKADWSELCPESPNRCRIQCFGPNPSISSSL